MLLPWTCCSSIGIFLPLHIIYNNIWVLLVMRDFADAQYKLVLESGVDLLVIDH
jgi:hypothetical protein